ncbi:hypothetical protein [Enterovibrio nigricans]|uniref:hypothetical protein n=1 Tax=Enterovibrio nigricans TaxID=504469 RepID=UPI001FCD4C77|nr:hypothetical protein [Enterovibrio nigricans]
MSSSRSVIIAGATGLVGDELLHQLLGDPDVYTFMSSHAVLSQLPQKKSSSISVRICL